MEMFWSAPSTAIPSQKATRGGFSISRHTTDRRGSAPLRRKMEAVSVKAEDPHDHSLNGSTCNEKSIN